MFKTLTKQLFKISPKCMNKFKTNKKTLKLKNPSYLTKINKLKIMKEMTFLKISKPLI